MTPQNAVVVASVALCVLVGASMAYVFNSRRNELADGPSLRLRNAFDEEEGGTSKSPVLSDPSVSTSQDGAVLTWNTSDLTTGIVSYGLEATNQPQIIRAADPQVAHRVELSGLQENATYYYRVTAVTKDGGLAMSPIRTFTTQP